MNDTLTELQEALESKVKNYEETKSSSGRVSSLWVLSYLLDILLVNLLHEAIESHLLLHR